MRTKEVEVWVDPKDFDNPHEVALWMKVSKYQAAHLIKAKLIIELPEKKIEITESQFEELFKKYEGQGSADFFKNMLKEKLFGNN